MKIAFVAQAGLDVGFGHIRRCEILAAECGARGFETALLAYDEGTLPSLPAVHRAKWAASKDLPAADAVVWDIRDPMPAQALQACRDRGACALLLDELGDARRVADVVVDALMVPQRATRYAEGAETRYLYGLDYLALDPGLRARALAAAPLGAAPLLCFGGADAAGATVAVLRALARKKFPGPLTVIGGVGNPDFPEIRALCATMNGAAHSFSEDLPRLIAAASLVVTKLGLTTFEAFALGTPCISLEPTAAHERLSRELAECYSDWPAVNAGRLSPESVERAVEEIFRLSLSDEARASASARGRAFVDLGGAGRIVDAIEEMTGRR